MKGCRRLSIVLTLVFWCLAGSARASDSGSNLFEFSAVELLRKALGTSQMPSATRTLAGPMSSLQGVIDAHCGHLQPPPLQTSWDFIGTYGACLRSHERHIRSISPGNALGLSISVESSADWVVVEKMQGIVTIQGVNQGQGWKATVQIEAIQVWSPLPPPQLGLPPPHDPDPPVPPEPKLEPPRQPDYPYYHPPRWYPGPPFQPAPPPGGQEPVAPGRPRPPSIPGPMPPLPLDPPSIPHPMPPLPL